MCNTAAHLVGRVLPSVPVRQWVLSLPFELRRTAAFRADVATALGRIFIEVVAANQKHRAGILPFAPLILEQWALQSALAKCASWSSCSLSNAGRAVARWT
jgi:hypothetical protein